MLARDYSEEEIRELFMEDGRKEERANTEAERVRADKAESRADKAEAENKVLREEIARLKAAQA
ncbi:MAG: hypothetical protein IJU43_03625 [Lachnospiraceae bacterium]|nr:hypothetical protein [Lachnospiraceae bacterium]